MGSSGPKEILHHFFEHLGIDVPSEKNMFNALEKTKETMRNKGLIEEDESIIFSIGDEREKEVANKKFNSRVSKSPSDKKLSSKNLRSLKKYHKK